MKRSAICLTLIALLSSSCLVGPDYKGVQDVRLPVTWVNDMPPASDETSLTRWWESFGDPQLNDLITTAFRNNPDEITALLNILKGESALRSTRPGVRQ